MTKPFETCRVRLGSPLRQALQSLDDSALGVSFAYGLDTVPTIILADAKFEFGRHNGEVLLGDEICPDTCRYWDKVTREKLDKDRFRRDLGNVEGAYKEMMERVSG